MVRGIFVHGWSDLRNAQQSLSSLFRCSSGLASTSRFGSAERRSTAATSAEGGNNEAESDDDLGAEAAEAAMLTEEEALIITNRLHQVDFGRPAVKIPAPSQRPACIPVVPDQMPLHLLAPRSCAPSCCAA